MSVEYTMKYILLMSIFYLSGESPPSTFFFFLLYLELGFLSVAYLTVANLARLGISVHW